MFTFSGLMVNNKPIPEMAFIAMPNPVINRIIIDSPMNNEPFEI